MLKEPRITKLILFWKKVFEKIDSEIYYLFAYRHPLGVAKSLAKRDYFTFSKSLFLWESYNLYCLLGLKKEALLYINYDAFMHNAQPILQEISAFVGKDILDDEEKEFLEEFLDPKLQNFSESSLETEKFYSDTYQYIKNYVQGVKNEKNFDDICSAFEKQSVKYAIEDQNTFTRALMEQENAQLKLRIEQLEQVHHQMEHSLHQLKEIEQNYTQILQSKSWKLMQPLRSLENMLSGR